MMYKKKVNLWQCILGIIFILLFLPLAGTAESERRQEILQKYDVNGDGVLSDTERSDALKARKPEIFEKYDVDGNGVLSEKERQVARSKLKKRKLGKGRHRHRRHE